MGEILLLPQFSWRSETTPVRFYSFFSSLSAPRISSSPAVTMITKVQTKGTIISANLDKLLTPLSLMQVITSLLVLSSSGAFGQLATNDTRNGRKFFIKIMILESKWEDQAFTGSFLKPAMDFKSLRAHLQAGHK